MHIHGNRLCRLLAYPLLAALLTTVSLASHAQQNTPDDYYRAEFVILERIIDPGEVNERMLNQRVAAPVETSEVLYSLASGGAANSTLELVPRNQLHLGNAANRLERSGRYRVLMSAGWYEAFPPDYKGEPLRIEIGDWLQQAGQREIEGHITIDRQRYLHVNVHLNHWQEATIAAAPVIDAGEAGLAGDSAKDPANENTLAPQPEIPLELLTWIRETRRMRSEEIHFLDSPTIGVLVFFKKIESVNQAE